MRDPKTDPPCRLVFTVNAGRSGSNYLAHVLGTVLGVTSLHEPGKDHGSLGIVQVSGTFFVKTGDKT